MTQTTQTIEAMQRDAGATFVPFGSTGETDAESPSPDPSLKGGGRESESPSPGPSLEGGGREAAASRVQGAVELVETFGAYEAEYAAIRKGVGIRHEPQRGLLRFTGRDVKDFLHRMLTADVNAMTGGQSGASFQINVKGRIMGDLVVHHGDESTWLEADACDLDAVAELYDQRLFGEDVTIANITAEREKLSLHGPQAVALLEAIGVDGAKTVAEMAGTHHVLAWQGAIADRAADKAELFRFTVYRRDECGVPGLHLWPPRGHAARLYAALAEAVGGLVPDVDQSQGVREGAGTRRPIVGRGVGWLAFNTARIEAGTPLFHIDFGPDSLPHETGVLDDRVSFTKGCYLGQEIVARMQSLGHPKRVLVGFRCTDDRLPIAGSQVTEASEGEEGKVIGAVTSSTLSPMLGNIAIGIVSMKWGKHRPGTAILLPAEGEMVRGETCELKMVKGAS